LLISELIAQHLTDSQPGKNPQFPLPDLLRQSVYSRIAGYEDVEDVNDAERRSTASSSTGRRLSIFHSG